ncbi:MAG: protein TolR [Desulfuromonadales bacterium]|nr:protein TolR [Desulfuromonadales bacterium]NIS44275.1 protein TolR [Desulfuromonadales bacterium]
MEVGRRDTGSRRTLSQINVTPFVDVMLVLLIIFMVTAPMMEQGFDVNLPEVENAPGIASKEEPLVVTIDSRGRISIGKSRVNSPAKLIPLLRQIMKERKEQSVLLEADQAVAYGKVMQVMAAVKQAGIARVGMMTQPPRK